MNSLFSQIQSAFAKRPHPGDENITHCSYETKNGGTLDGPCWECEEMSNFFRRKSWGMLHGLELRRYGDNDTLFTVKAYCYFLPSYLTASLRERKDLDDCVDHLTYRFGVETDDKRGGERLRSLFKELSRSELGAVLAYFRYVLSRDGNWGGFCARAIENIEQELSKTP